MNLLQETIEMVKEIAGSEMLYLDHAVVVKQTPHTIPVNIWGICVSPDNRLYVMDSEEQWNEVEQEDTLIIPTLYQRIKSISKKVLHTSI